MICSISGEPATEPVLSPSSSRIFEKRLIVEYINQNGLDPISQQPLSLDDLLPIDLSYSEKPLIVKDSNHTSIPSLLSVFQKEWDSLALEMFELRKQLTDTKKELSLALYKQDAAVRVAAHAIQERDEAKKALQDLAIQIGRGEPIPELMDSIPIEQDQDYEEEDIEPMSPDVISNLQSSQMKLYEQHKSEKFKFPFGTAPLSTTVESTQQVFKVTKKTTIKYSALNHDQTMVSIVLSNNKQIIYDLQNSEILNTFTATKSQVITCLTWLSDNYMVAYGCSNGDILLSLPTESSNQLKISTTEPIVSIIQHPGLKYFIAASKYRYTIYDYSDVHDQELPVAIYKSKKTSIDYTASTIHTDGLLTAFGLSGTSQVSIVDIVQCQEALKIEPPTEVQSATESRVTKLLFAPNGYSLIISYSITNDNGSQRKIVGIYDVRKAVFQSVLAPSEITSESLSVDKSSSLLIIGKSAFRYSKKGKVWGSEETGLLDSLGCATIVSSVVRVDYGLKLIGDDGLFYSAKITGN